MSTTPVAINVKLNARLQPEHRLQLFEDPLEAMLEAAGVGEIMGGGTALTEEGEVEYGDLEIQLHDAAALPTVIELLEQLGAPKGSLIQREGEPDVSFGITEGLGLYLNGTDLPDEVYQNSDVNELIDRLGDSLGDRGSMYSYWEGPTETALYFYGPSADEMKRLMADVLGTHPLAQRCRVVGLTS